MDKNNLKLKLIVGSILPLGLTSVIAPALVTTSCSEQNNSDDPGDNPDEPIVPPVDPIPTGLAHVYNETNLTVNKSTFLVIDLSEINFNVNKTGYVVFKQKSTKVTFGKNELSSSIVKVNFIDNKAIATVKVNCNDSSTNANLKYSIKLTVYEDDESNIPTNPESIPDTAEGLDEDEVELTFNQSKLVITNIVNQQVVGNTNSSSDEIQITLQRYNITVNKPLVTSSNSTVIPHPDNVPEFGSNDICTITLNPNTVLTDTSVTIQIKLDNCFTSCDVLVLKPYQPISDLVVNDSLVVADGSDTKYQVTANNFPEILNGSKVNITS